MTALGFMLFARGWKVRGRRAARFTPALWPVVALAVVLWCATCCSGADATPAGASLLGQPRDVVLDQLGKPLSALQRGDTEVLMYPNNVRIEVRHGEVVSFRSGNQAVLVKSDGSRYAASDQGKVSRLETPPPAPAPTETKAAPPPVEVEPENAAPPVATPPATKAPVAEEEEAVTPAPTVPGIDPDSQMMKMAQNYAENGKLTEETVKPPPPWAKVVSTVLSIGFRLVIALVILRVAVSWVGLPCYLPDLAKVAALYVVVREGMHGLGGLGGHWEFIRLFMIDDVVSFFALCGLLYKFKIALSGITALKIGAMTSLVTYFAMMAVTIGILFGLGSFY